MTASQAGRLVLLTTSHRVAAGLLTADAWRVLHDGDVLVADDDHPLLPALAEQGIAVTRLGPADPGDWARSVVARATEASRPVVWLVADDGDPGLVEALAPALALPGAGPAPDVEVLPGSYDIPGARLLDLVSVMDRLRSPGGCPWDAAQTHTSLAPYLLEETYEVLEAIGTEDDDALREELGDLLLQVVFHARVAEERTERPWSVDDVAAGIVAKLVRRHPHVFADVDAPTAEHVEANWQAIKAAEKGGRASAVDGVPLSLPALALATTLADRAARAGVPVEVADPELPDDVTAEQLGELLLALAVWAGRHGLDPEAALRDAARGFAGRVRAAE